MYRSLTTQNPDQFRPLLAASLDNLAVGLSEAGQRTDALEVADEVVAIYRALAAQHPERFRVALARSLDKVAKPPADATRELCLFSFSHADAAWRNRLLVLLKPFVRQGRIQVWADPSIKVGEVWRREIDSALVRARVAVVLLTNSLLASEFITTIEIPRLLRASRDGELTLIVVPIQRHPEGATRLY